MSESPPTVLANDGLRLEKAVGAGGVRRSSPSERVAAGILSAGALAILLTAALLDPSPSGSGTHTQLGLPSCTWLAVFGVPCPTCGMTTSFSYAAEGRYAASVLAQPAGFLLALVTAMTVWIGGHIAVFGSTIGRALTRILGSRALWIGLGLLMAAWVYKIVAHQG